MLKVSIEDYTFIESEQDDQWAVRLRSEFPGVDFMFGEIKVREVDEEAILDFKYYIMDPGEFEKDWLDENEDFKNYIGQVLQHIIMDAAENGKIRNERSEHTTNDPEESPFQ